ncbi:MAG: SDR family oxidoreductase, partial [Pseudomonadota bacterium]
MSQTEPKSAASPLPLPGDLPKTALITGGATRVGAALALGLAQAGFAIGLHYRGSRDAAEQTARAIEAVGSRVTLLQAELTNMAETERMMPAVHKAFGPVGVLINNASTFESDSLTDFNEALWDTHFDVHVKAPVRLAGQMSDLLPEGNNGLIINVIDQRVWKLTPGFTSYTLSKAALWAATQTMAQALAPRIRVNAIGPGPTLPSPRQVQEDFDAQVASVPLQRAPSLDEFVETA